MKSISCADLIWVATALLSREDPERTGFSHEEIRNKVYAIEAEHGFRDSTVRTHISKQCVANTKPDPGKHRMLYRNPDQTYRLYRPGDDYHPDRSSGKSVPRAEQLPTKYRELVRWYESQHGTSAAKPQTDPLLALRGLGKEVWKELGGGENFIRRMRENWYGTRPDPVAEKLSKKDKRAS